MPMSSRAVRPGIRRLQPRKAISAMRVSGRVAEQPAHAGGAVLIVNLRMRSGNLALLNGSSQAGRASVATGSRTTNYSSRSLRSRRTRSPPCISANHYDAY